MHKKILEEIRTNGGFSQQRIHSMIGNPEKISDVRIDTRYDRPCILYMTNKENGANSYFCESIEDVERNAERLVVPVRIAKYDDYDADAKIEYRGWNIKNLDIFIEPKKLSGVMRIPELMSEEERRRYGELLSYNIAWSYHAMGLALPGFPVMEVLEANRINFSLEMSLKEFAKNLADHGDKRMMEKMLSRRIGEARPEDSVIEREAKAKELVKNTVTAFAEGMIEGRKPSRSFELRKMWYDLMDIAWGRDSYLYGLGITRKESVDEEYVFTDEEGIKRRFYQNIAEKKPEMCAGLFSHQVYENDIAVKEAFYEALLKHTDAVLNSFSSKMRRGLLETLSRGPEETKRYLRSLFYAMNGRETIGERSFRDYELR